MAKRRRFFRPTGKRPYRRKVILAVEGSVTEPLYFSLFNSEDSVICVKCLKGKHDSAPKHVLKRMEKYIKSEGINNKDQAWLVVDKDSWSDDQLMELFNWSELRENYGFSLSNPNFEFWLLLHFEDGNGISSSRDCKERLCRCFPNYDKSFDSRKITMEMRRDAINRAENKDVPPCEDWPRSNGSTVYRLVKKIISLRFKYNNSKKI